MAKRSVTTVFGGSGFLGRHLVRRLAATGSIVRIAVRDPEASLFLKTAGEVGQVVPLHAPLDRAADVARAVEGADVVINLVGILAETRAGDFDRVHQEGAGRVATLAAKAGVARLVHVSAIGADAASNSLYARSKAAGEAAVRAAFPDATVLRPSILFGPEDDFFNRFARMAALLPVVPIVHGATRLQPVYVGDVAAAVLAAAPGRTYELGGPQVRSFRDLVAYALALAGLYRPILDLKPGLAALQAAVLERLPGKLLTRDQVRLLERDNIVAPGSLDLASLGLTPTPLDLVVPGYLARRRPRGQGGWT